MLTLFFWPYLLEDNNDQGLQFHRFTIELLLICGCFMLGMTFLPWWLVLSMMSGNLFTSLWVFLKCKTL